MVRPGSGARPSTRRAGTGGTAGPTSTLPRPLGAGAAAAEGPLVLLVDDDERVRELVRVTLESEGYRVPRGGNAEEGLAALEEERPDLILLDVLMPQVDGWEMLRRVQERYGVGAIPS